MGLEAASRVIEESQQRDLEEREKDEETLERLVVQLIKPHGETLAKIEKERRERIKNRQSKEIQSVNYEALAEKIIQDIKSMDPRITSTKDIAARIRGHLGTISRIKIDDEYVERVNRDFSNGRKSNFEKLLEKLGIYDFPFYIRKLTRDLVEDAFIDVEKAYKLLPHEFERINKNADEFAEKVLCQPLHPDVLGNCSGEKLKKIIREGNCTTADDFHRVRSANAKARFVFVLHTIRSTYHEKKIGEGSKDLKKLLGRVSKVEEDRTVILNPPRTPSQKRANEINENSIHVQSIDVDSSGKKIESIAIKALAKGEEDIANIIKDKIRFRIKVRPEDCRSVEKFVRTSKKILGVIMGVIQTSTVHENILSEIRFTNVVPLEHGEEHLSLEEFSRKMATKKLKTAGKNENSSIAHRGIAGRITWTNSKDGRAHTVEFQIVMPTPDDHALYERKKKIKINEACGFGKKSNGDCIPITFEDFIQDLIRGVHLKGSLQRHYDPVHDRPIKRPVDETVLLTILEAITKKDLEGNLINTNLIERLKGNPEILDQLSAIVKQAYDHSAHISESRRKQLAKYDQQVKRSGYFKEKARKAAEILGTQLEMEKSKTASPKKPLTESWEELPLNSNAIGKKNVTVVAVNRIQANGKSHPKEKTVYYKETDKEGVERRYMRYNAETANGEQILTIRYPNPTKGNIVYTQFQWSIPKDEATFDTIPRTEAILDKKIDYFALDEKGTTDYRHCDIYDYEENLWGKNKEKIRVKRRMNPEKNTVTETQYKKTKFLGTKKTVYVEPIKTRLK
ncbi:MAG: hypothetical protein ACD_28C00282G0003 [uncultured bacterium]|nr:MAG: hypothetical protein ACD_28C00282G0003 [uncultured bacterium]